VTLVLAIETSCDETACAVVRDGREILANVVASQVELHRKYGGVFPEMASRQHMVAITPVIREALSRAKVGWQDLAAIAVVYGPGLGGALLVGLNAAKAIAWCYDLPLIGVNHLEAHVYANWLRPEDVPAESFLPPSFPLVCLVVSGGHTDLILMRDHHDYEHLGGTRDDAAGEAFDKVARLLGLGYPGGPQIERIAREGDPKAFNFPRALSVGPFDFSFSGLKTAVLRLVQDLGKSPNTRGQKLADVRVTDSEAVPVADIAASFQEAVVEALVTKTVQAVRAFDVSQVLLAGGVAANQLLRRRMQEALDIPVRYPPIRFCTDNAAMVAALGYYRLLAGERADWGLDVVPSLHFVK